MDKKGAFQLRKAKQKLRNVKAKFYLQDPLVAAARRRVGIAELEIEGEAVLGDGPTNSRVAIVDYNGEQDKVFAPARLKADGDGFDVERGEPVENLQFHQVSVWAIINHTLRQMESPKIFGRRIPWAFKGGRLLVLPHAGYWENAYYDRETGALHFFYFEGPDGNPVYTCLSHDIVTHELGHAILDGLKPYYNEVSSPATAGFHEYFGDAVAMTSALFHRELIVEVAGRVGSLRGNNLIAGIAAEFGRATSHDTYGDISEHYLRSGNNQLTMDDLDGVYEEHDYSLVLVGTYYDLLLALYESSLQIILDGANAKAKAKGRAKVVENGGHRVRALYVAAKISARMTLRAVDYCNPVDIDYSDYARAILRADEIAYPVDTRGCRAMASEVFLKRKLAASAADLECDFEHHVPNDELRNLKIEKLGASKTDAYHFVDDNRRVLGIPAEANFELVDVCQTNKRSARDRRLPKETIVQFVWAEAIRLSGAEYGDVSGARMNLWCGGSLVFDREGNLLHYTLKTNTRERRRTLREYMAYLIREGYFTLDSGERGRGARGHGDNVVVGEIKAGVLRMSRSAAFRHTHRRAS